jgi:uncharacterized protein (UPF0261 family)
MKKTIAIVGALDTKGQEFAFLKAEIEKHGCATLVVDVGVLGKAAFNPDVSRERVAQAGGSSLSQLVERKDRGEAMTVMTKGVAEIAKKLYEGGQIDGIVSMGGGGGTVIGTSAMRALPVGFPKLMVSTLASGDTAPYIGTTDITMMPSVVDVAGVNRISRRIYSNAAGAICGMVVGELEAGDDKPLIAASMFGNTTIAVDHARQIMESKGYEVLVFHATGTGGQTMEALIADNYIAGVLDITTTEWADEVCGGVLSAGPHRLEAAAKARIPQVVVPGCIDMCNFWARNTVPERYEGRTFYEWNPNVTLMRTTPEENQQMGKIFAEKLNAAIGPVAVLIPTKGFSQIDLEGQPFYWPEANQAFINALKDELRQDIPIRELDYDINAPEFSRQVAETLLAMLET